jgi:hypothetical protein
MNIIKLQNMLRGVADEALINYVQNPQGEVPSYLALSELQRRKDTRAKYQAEQTPESSVAEDLGQEATQNQSGLAMLAGQTQQDMGEQGVASLPVDDDMYQEDSFAAGGIVAFAPGGPVYPNYEGPATSAIGRGFGYITGGVKKYADRKSQLLELERQKESLRPNIFESLTPSQLSTRKAQIAEIEAKQDAIRNPSSGYVYKEGESAVDPTMKSYVDQEVQRKLEVPKEKPKAIEGKPASKTEPTQTQSQTQTQTSQQPADSYEDALRKRMSIYKEFMGPNEDRDRLNKKIEAMEARAARQEEMAPWMALTEAGFKTMQGTSPFALANIGAGAEAGIRSYGAAQDRLANLEEKRYALMNEAAKADRAEKQAAITFGENSYQHQATLEQKERLGLADLELKREANRIEREVGLGRNAAMQGRGTVGTTKGMVEQILKINKPLLEELSIYNKITNPNEKQKAYVKKLQSDIAANEAKIKAYYNKQGLAGIETSASDADPLGIL